MVEAAALARPAPQHSTGKGRSVLKILNALNSLVGGLLTLALLGTLGFGGWFVYRTYYARQLALEETQAKLADQEAEAKKLAQDLEAKQKEVQRLGADLTTSQKEVGRLTKTVQRQTAEIVSLNKDLEAKRVEIERLQTVVKLLKLDHRVALITVLDQKRSDDGTQVHTKFSFVEVNEEGRPLEEPRVFEIQGDVVYLDAWVVKFGFDYLEQGDPLRSTSICLFRRIFGESQAPSEGFALDTGGNAPAAYRTGGKPSEFEQQIWSRFWEYANNPTLAKQAGVRAAHGEAPSIKLLPGKRYRVVLQATGGLRIDPPEEAKTATQ